MVLSALMTAAAGTHNCHPVSPEKGGWLRSAMHNIEDSRFDLWLLLCAFCCVSRRPSLPYFPMENFFKATFLCLVLAFHLLSLLQRLVSCITAKVRHWSSAVTASWSIFGCWNLPEDLPVSQGQHISLIQLNTTSMCHFWCVISVTTAVGAPKYHKIMLLPPLSTHSPILTLKRER